MIKEYFQFITDEGVEPCGSLNMSLDTGKENMQVPPSNWGEPREIQGRISSALLLKKSVM